MKTPKEVLVAARAVIEKPENWCQRFWEDGGRRCAASAVGSVCQSQDEYNSAYNVLRQQMGDMVSSFNDTHTHAEVIAAFDKAIECAAS